MMPLALSCPLLSLVLALGLAVGQPTKVHVIFSQHLDVGYNSQTQGVTATDDAAINLYFDRHFPNAVATVKAFQSQNSTRSYRWMAHAWLFSLYFDCPIGMGLHCPSADAKKDVEEAIRQGSIYWHALPFNGQAEFFDAPLLEYAPFLVHRLDDQFKVPHKRVASLRDVPGITRAAIPILTGQGVRALSQGVNGASAPPGLPKDSLLIWRDPGSGAELLHWVHAGGYSGYPQDAPQECLQHPNFTHILCHAWKLDNEGPHTFEEATKVFGLYEAAFPGAEVVASSFDEYLSEVDRVRSDLTLPVYSGEIGDTWIYGIPSDALKVSRYLAALRLRAAMTWRYDDYAYFNFSRLLMKVPEHTWGVDIRWTINDYSNWDNKRFHALLKSGATNFKEAARSWQRQAKYVDWALEALGLSPEALGPQLATTQLPALEGYTELLPGSSLLAGEWAFVVDPKTGALQKLQRQWGDSERGVDWASPSAPLSQLVYETFKEDDFNVIFDHYIYAANARSWADYDFGKGVGEGEVNVLIHSLFPEWAWRDAGAPREVWTQIQGAPQDGNLYVDISFRQKTPTRLPEAAWVKFQPTDAADPSTWLLYKLGQPVSPLEVMLNGSQSQHTVSAEGISIRSHYDEQGSAEILTIRSLDAPLVSPGKATPFPIGATKPDLSHGVSYGIINNAWGTNYPQWQPYDEHGENLTFRFILSVEKTSRPRKGRPELLCSAGNCQGMVQTS